MEPSTCVFHEWSYAFLLHEPASHKLLQGHTVGKDTALDLPEHRSGQKKGWPGGQAGVARSLIMPPTTGRKRAKELSQSSQFRSVNQFVILGANQPSWNGVQRKNHCGSAAKSYARRLQGARPLSPQPEATHGCAFVGGAGIGTGSCTHS